MTYKLPPHTCQRNAFARTRHTPLQRQRPIVRPVAMAKTNVVGPASDTSLGLARSILSRPGLEGDVLSFLKVSEAYWRAMRTAKHEPHKKGPTVVKRQQGEKLRTSTSSPSEPSDSTSVQLSAQQPLYDVAVLGGTLGLLIACALQLQGFSVVVVEKRRAEGRTQEWNLSRFEYQVLSDVGVLTEAELEAAIVTEFNPVRAGFKGGQDVWVRDCLNLGIRPRTLLQSLRNRFLAAGGTLMEDTAFRSATVLDDGVRLHLVSGGTAAPVAVGDTNRPNGLTAVKGDSRNSAHGAQHSDGLRHTPGSDSYSRTPGGGGGTAQSRYSSGAASVGCCATDPAARSSAGGGAGDGAAAEKRLPRSVDCRLVLDCMGHYSEIVKQIRGRAKPDGIVMVVGSCATGIPPAKNASGDLLYSMTDAVDGMQLFWEAFPAEGGAARTTYMFAYTDADPSRPTFEAMLDTYFKLLPQYQGVLLDSLDFKRVLFGAFPSYADLPLKPGFDRILQVGDASCVQSPLSFGGFGSLVRHLPRLVEGIADALRRDRLSRTDLQWLQPYQPSLSAAWLFQRSMSIGVGQLQDSQTGSVQQARHEASRQGTPAAMGHAAATAAAACGSSVAGGVACPEGPEDAACEGGSDAAGAALSMPGSGKVATAAGRGLAGGAERQGAVSLPQWAQLPPHHVNEVLAANFAVMQLLGDRVMRPFLQDTIQALPVTLTMAGMMLKNPVAISRVLLQVGLPTLVSWFGHYSALLAYTVLHMVVAPILRPLSRHSYILARALDAWRYGSGSDHVYHAPSVQPSTPPLSQGVSDEWQRATPGSGRAVATHGTEATAAGAAAGLSQRPAAEHSREMDSKAGSSRARVGVALGMAADNAHGRGSGSNDGDSDGSGSDDNAGQMCSEEMVGVTSGAQWDVAGARSYTAVR